MLWIFLMSLWILYMLYKVLLLWLYIFDQTCCFREAETHLSAAPGCCEKLMSLWILYNSYKLLLLWTCIFDQTWGRGSTQHSTCNMNVYVHTTIITTTPTFTQTLKCLFIFYSFLLSTNPMKRHKPVNLSSNMYCMYSKSDILYFFCGGPKTIKNMSVTMNTHCNLFKINLT